MSTQELMNDRYGRNKAKARDRLFAYIAASVLILAFLIFLVNSVFLAPGKATGEVTKFTMVSSQLAHVEGYLQKPKESTAVCQVAVRNGNLSIVGYLEVTAPAGETTSQFSVDVRTTEATESAVVQDCALR